jgi:hypothetical protein
MKSENSANPAADEEVIDLTDVVKSGPEAEEAIIDLTDPIETVEAGPHETEELSSDGRPLELGKMLAPDDVQKGGDLTARLDAAPAAQDFLDQDETLDFDLDDALDAPQEQETVLDLDEVLAEDEPVLDLTQTVADTEEEFAADPEVLDLAKVLDAAETEDDLLELEESGAGGAAKDAALLSKETLEVIEEMPAEITDADDNGDGDEDSVLVMEMPSADEADAQELGLNAVELLDSDVALDDWVDEAAGTEPDLDLVDAVGETARTAMDAADDADDGDELEFKLDEMLAEAQADMPDVDDDGSDMDLDLSEALAEAAAESTEPEPEAVLDLGASVAPTPAEGREDMDAFDLISEDKVVELDDFGESGESPTDLEQTAPDNVIELADVTGGYPTETAQEAGQEDLDAAVEIQAVEEADSIVEEDLQGGDLDIGLEAPAVAKVETELNPEMLKFEATLDEVLQDDEGDDMSLGMFADDAAEDDGETEPSAAAESLDAAQSLDATESGKKAESGMKAAGALGTAALGAAALSASAAGAAASISGELNFEGPPTEISEEKLDAAVARVVKTMYADRIEQMVLDVIREAVTAEIEKVRRSLSD